jgi:adenylate cyclase class 2
MTYEVEQKFPVGDTGQLIKKLADLDAVAAPSVEQVDRYYAHPARDFAATDEALRIRRVGEENFVTYKGPKLDRTTKTRREIELPLSSGESGFKGFVSLLEALGFGTVAEVRKTRRPFEIRWQNQLVQAALDDVTSVGTFVELELMAEADEVESAKACLASLAQHLQLPESERRSYLELLLARTNA